MTDNDEIDYDALEAELTDPRIPVKSTGQSRSGAAAAATGHAFLLREYGSEEAIEAALRVPAPGRPRLGERAGASPTVRGRLAPADYAALKTLEERTGRTQSQLVRDAVHQLLVEHDLATG